MTTTLYIIRHGQTKSNTRLTYQGSTDNPLNQTGCEQAEALGAIFKKIPLDAVISSPLKRAADTAHSIRNTVITNDLLRERNFGIWDDLTYEEICRQYPDEVQQWNQDWQGFRPQNGESAMDVQRRAQAFKVFLSNKYHGKTVAIVSHLGFIRHFITVLMDLPVEQLWHFRLENGSFFKIEITDGFAVLQM